MVNREAASPEGIPHRPKQSWDIGAISQALDHSPEATRDVAHGSGVRYVLADGALTVDLFPPHAERRRGIVRLSTADSLQEFYRQPQPAIRDEGLIFETSELLISLSPTGELMTYRVVPDEGTVEPPDACKDPEDPESRSGGNDGSGDDSVASGKGFQRALPESQEQPRVTYSGRLGTDPRTKVTPKGTFVMEFPVAVAVEGQDKPNWHNTVVFDEKARKLDGVLSKGIAVDCIAYEHRKERRDEKTGRRRETIEYYAVAVTPKLRKTQEARGATGIVLEHPTANAVSQGAERPIPQERSARPQPSE
jgi:single-stranded DNA-binding protein